MEANTMMRTISCKHNLSVDIHVQTPQIQSSSGAVSFASFATGEKIHGTVSIVAQNDLRFDNIYIMFLGEQSTNIPSESPGKAHIQFLKQIYEIPEDILASPGVFKINKRYEIPFVFEVTDYLAASSCTHSANPLVKAAHLHPPPSCGDASIAGFGGKLRDDFAPTACRILYSIYVKIERSSMTTGLQETYLEKRAKVRVKPAIGEVPLPELPSSLSNEYNLFREETIQDPSSRKTTLGRINVTLEQPGCFYHPLRDPIRLISKAVRIFLVYHQSNPESTKPPPELKSLKAQIIATTMYTTNLRETHPLAKKRDLFKRPINYRDAELPLSIPSIPQLSWKYDQSYKAYTATLLVPVTLPKDKSFIPTFHSCLISRVYSLDFQLSVQGASSTVKLRAPMQIAAERDPSALPSYNASLGVVDVAD
ncbi:hypothetical protein BJY04DRAFT_213817 [Aspergillus karnatakaensis]|uniref:uncharacterized protein n=1 Tax=Aspergillus karnatakaensis TaxID=1810916 RepID=UPI003CCE3473